MFIKTQYGHVLNSDKILAYSILPLGDSSDYKFTIQLEHNISYRVCYDTKNKQELEMLRNDKLLAIIEGKSYWSYPKEED